ncbi:MAG TPA: metalloregulator ArsR/SmtB family transcription factor [Dehalococcoidia bacterium]|nr:metalloregulator ArsR/SmtB family transcription factor [Dehalococcoidia bacterium]
MTVDRLVDACNVRQIDAEKVQQGRALLLGDEVYSSTAEMFRALGDTSRAKIVFSLLQQELCVCDLAAVCDLSESATSQHLRILRGLRIVKVRRDGRMSHYSIDDDHIRVLLGVCLNHLHDREALEGIA